MNPPCLSPFYRVNSRVVAALSLALNVALALLVLFRATPELRHYSRLLFVSCVMELVFAVACFLVDEHLFFHNGVLSMALNGYYSQSYETNFHFVMFAIYVLYATLTVEAIPLVFRYFSVCRQRNMNSKQLLCIVAVALALPLIIIVPAYHVWYNNGKEIARISNIPTCASSGLVPLFTADQISSTFSKALPLLGGVLNVSVTYSTIVVCIVSVWLTVRRGSFSARTKELQRQLNSALLVQVVSPLIMMALPLGFALGAMLLRSERAGYALPAVTAITAWIPVVNALSTIYFIRACRDAVLQIIRVLAWKRSQPHTKPFTAVV